MNWNIVEGKWKELSGSVKEKWADLTDDEVAQTEGNYEKFVGLVQTKLGIAQEEAKKHVDEWANKLGDMVSK
jgi:uncharacterized protein YjbJ (UPF0337 family)